MKVSIIKVGNSKGIRIPKPIVEQCGFGETVELTVRDNCLMISSLHNPRSGWDQAFQQMSKRGDDRLMDADVGSSKWDDQEWVW